MFQRFYEKGKGAACDWLKSIVFYVSGIAPFADKFRSLYSLSLIKVSMLMVVLYSGLLTKTFSFYSLYFLRFSEKI